MNALIAEDEIEAAELLTSLIHDIDPTMNITQRVDSVQEIINYFESGKKADVIFMDVQLADGKCFEVFDKVTIDNPVIFTTAFDQFAIQAFKFHSIDYLLKPVQSGDLKKALNKLQKIAGKQLSSDDITALKEIISTASNKYKQRILIKSGNKLQYKPVSNVAYFFADGKVAYLVSVDDGRKSLIDHTLEDLETLLNPDIFFRISRKFIVNFEAVSEIKGLISAHMEVKLTQPCEHQLHISRDRVHQFKRWLDR